MKIIVTVSRSSGSQWILLKCVHHGVVQLNISFLEKLLLSITTAFVGK